MGSGKRGFFGEGCAAAINKKLEVWEVRKHGGLVVSGAGRGICTAKTGKNHHGANTESLGIVSFAERDGLQSPGMPRHTIAEWCGWVRDLLKPCQAAPSKDSKTQT